MISPFISTSRATLNGRRLRSFVTGCGLALAVIWFASGCHMRLTARALNDRFFAEMPSDVPPEDVRVLRYILLTAESPKVSSWSQQVRLLIRDLYEAQRGGKTERVAAIETWERLMLAGAQDGAMSHHGPTRASRGENWKTGFVIVPRVMPAPVSIDPFLNGIPHDAELAFEFVPLDVASRRKYEMSPAKGPDGT